MTNRLVRPRWETPKPRGVVGSYGPMVVDWLSRELGITADPWQDYTLGKALRYDRNGDLIHRTALISTGRQNGKSVDVRGFFGWMLDEGHELPAFRGWTEMLAAAHDAKQARIIYKGVYRDFLGIPRIAALAKGQRQNKPVRLTEHFGITMNGLEFDTVTGQPGSARGHSAGAVAWDEVLTQKDWDGYAALLPTQQAQRSPILLATSTAGFADSIVLRALYDRLVRIAKGQEKPDPTFYGVWWQSEDPDAGLDWRQVGQANPALGHGRLTKRGITSEFRTFPNELWRRERLNHWVEVKADVAFNPAVWASLRTADPLKDVEPPYYLGVDIQPGWDRATIAVAATRPDGRIGAEVYREFRAEDGAFSAETLIEAIDAFPQPIATVVYEGVSGAAGPFDRHGEGAWGVEWRPLKPNLTVAACMDVTQMILSRQLAVDDPLLDAQVELVARRPVGQDGAFRFSRTHSAGPIDAFMALTFAVQGVTAAVAPPKIV